MTATNGTTHRFAAELADLREALEVERLRAELTDARASTFTRHYVGRLLAEGAYDGFTGNDWGSLVDPMDAFRDQVGASAFPFLDRGYARRDGYNRPFLWSDLDLDLQRSTARWVWTKNRFAQGAVGRLQDYTVRTGFDYETVPHKHVTDPVAPQVAAAVDAFLSGEYRKANQWSALERSAVKRSVRDGELFWRHFAQPDGNTWVRVVEPEQIYQPMGSPPEWSWGIQCEPDDIWRPRMYCVRYTGAADENFVSAAEMLHLKRNTDECVKRGLSDFYCTGDTFDGTAKLLRNMLTSGGVQAAIAWIEQFAQANAQGVGNLVSSQRDANRPLFPQPITGKQINYAKYEPGSIPKVGAGKQYVAAPQAVGASVHIQIEQAALRSLGVRWGMPEYMISGDASNNNMASSLVAGSPFVTSVECEQNVTYAPFFLRSQWIAVKNWCDAGRCRVGGRVFTFAEVQALVDIHATPPNVAIANRKEEADADQGDIDRGVMSKQTRRAKLGLDDNKERHNLLTDPLTPKMTEKIDALAPPGGGPPIPQDGPAAPAPGPAPAPASAPTDAPGPANDLRATVGGLNGVLQLQTAYYAGEVPRDAAMANVQILLGFTDEEAQRLFPAEKPVALAAPPPAPPTVPAPAAKPPLREARFFPRRTKE